MPGDGCLNGLPVMADVRNTVDPATIGEDQPRPGTSMAHFTCSVFDQVSGNFASGASPLMPGPRKPGHEAGAIEDNDPTDATRTKALRAARRTSKGMLEAYRSPAESLSLAA